MASIVVDGVRMPWVRRCRCGLKPKVSTSYKGMTPGAGPFFIQCAHGVSDKEIEAQWEARLSGKGPGPRFDLYRSWSKTRAAHGWNRMQRQLEHEAADA